MWTDNILYIRQTYHDHYCITCGALVLKKYSPSPTINISRITDKPGAHSAAIQIYKQEYSVFVVWWCVGHR